MLSHSLLSFKKFCSKALPFSKSLNINPKIEFCPKIFSFRVDDEDEWMMWAAKDFIRLIIQNSKIWITINSIVRAFIDIKLGDRTVSVFYRSIWCEILRRKYFQQQFRFSSIYCEGEKRKLTSFWQHETAFLFANTVCLFV